MISISRTAKISAGQRKLLQDGEKLQQDDKIFCRTAKNSAGRVVADISG
jgi:hypothetical protein